MNKLHAIGEKLLPVIAYGDAAGLPFEGQRPVAFGSVEDLRDIQINPYVGEYPAGTWSDDTHLSLAVANSIIYAKGFDLQDQAEAHVRSWQFISGEIDDPQWSSPILTTDEQNGWGGSTTRSVERLAQGVDPRVSGEVGGVGNGVLMKLAPLLYWQLAQDIPSSEADQQIIDITKMTHNAPESIVSSLVHRDIMRGLLMSATLNPQEMYDAAIDNARLYEAQFDTDNKTSTVLERIGTDIETGTLTRQKIIEAAKKRGFYAPETLLMAYGSFVLENSFPDSVYRGVELGGDTDSVGSIVATMSLFLHGGVEKPADYNKLFDVTRLEDVSRSLTKLATQ